MLYDKLKILFPERSTQRKKKKKTYSGFVTSGNLRLPDNLLERENIYCRKNLNLAKKKQAKANYLDLETFSFCVIIGHTCICINKLAKGAKEP